MYCIESIIRNGSYVYFINVKSDNPNSPIMIFSHGFPDNGFGWESQIEKFKGKYNIVVLFMHGTLNNTKVQKSRISSDNIIQDVSEILDFVDPSSTKKIILVGHDLGCFLNITLYEQVKSRVIGIININGLGLHQYYSRKFNTGQWIKSYYVLLAQSIVTRLFVSKFFPHFFLKLIYKLSKVDPEDSLFENDERVLRGIAIYQILFVKMFSFFFEDIVKIKAPTLFLWGNKDNFLDIPSLDEIDKFYDKGTIRILKGGHWVHHSQRERANEIIEFTLNNWQLGSTV